MTRSSIIRFPRRRPSRQSINALVKHLNAGGLAVVPTETQYGLCGLATSAEAIRAVRTVKGRDANQPFSVFFRNSGDLSHWAIRLPGYARALADHFWPGPVTLVLPASGALPRRLGSNGSVGVRVSPEPVIAGMMARLRLPVIATSANPSGTVLTAPAENMWLTSLVMRGTILWMRPGRYVRRRASTVIDCTGTRPRELRPGAVPLSVWQKALK